MFANRTRSRSLFQFRSFACLGLATVLSLSVAAVARAESSHGQVIKLPVNAAANREHSTKKRIKKFELNPPDVARARLIHPNCTSVIVVAVNVGRTAVKLTDEDGKVDEFEVQVSAADIPHMMKTIRLAVPTANVRIVPADNNAIIVSGTVERPEDLFLVRQVVEAIAGKETAIIDGLRLVDGPKVQLDVVVVQAHSSLVNKLACVILERPETTAVLDKRASAMLSSRRTASQFLNVQGVLVPDPPLQRVPFLSGTLNASQAKQFRAFLNVLKDEGLVTILAEPRMKTVSGRLCTFCAGGMRIPDNIPALVGLVSGPCEKVETSISCLPTVRKDRQIQFELEVETSSPPGWTMNRTVQRVHQTLQAESGETLLLGGCISSTVGPKLKAIPLFDAPVPLGPAFFTRKMETKYSERIIFITPKILE